MIEGKNIFKNFGSLAVLKGVDIQINKGEMVTIVGPSGSGKSTLLHILGSLDKADRGSVIMNNENIRELSTAKLSAFRNKHIGFVFQFHHLLPEFTALENVCIPGWIAKRNKKEVEKEALALLEMLNLENRKNHKPGQLSGGEQQRVAVARSLINKPDIILADEPTGNLDTKNANELHSIFLKLKTEMNQTLLIVTHNESLAEISDRTLHMRDGLIV